MKQILLIEDNANQRVLYEEELQGEGYGVITAANSTEGLRLFKLHWPELVILDVQLPSADGLALIEGILATAPNQEIILYSAYSAPSHDFIIAFVRACLVKSGDLSQLKDAVHEALAEPMFAGAPRT